MPLMRDKVAPLIMKQHEIPGRVAVTTGNGGLTKIIVTTDAAPQRLICTARTSRIFKKTASRRCCS